MTHIALSLEQQGWRFRNDDGSESAATWQAVEGAPVAYTTNTNFRLRFLLQETGGGTSANSAFKLQYEKNGSATWTDITTTSSDVKLVTSTNLTDGADTTQQLGTGTYISSNGCVVESSNTFGDVSFTANSEVEVEASLNVTGTQGDYYRLRVRFSDGTGLAAYADVPHLVISGNGAEYTTVAAEETHTTVGETTSSLTLPQISGGTDMLYVVAVGIRLTNSVSSISGGGLTWTLRKRQLSGRSQVGVEVWTAHGSPSAFAASITMSASTDAITAVITRYSGADQTTPIEDAIGHNTNGENGAATGGVDDSAPQLTTGSTNADSVHYVAIVHRNSTITTDDADYLLRMMVEMDGDLAGDKLDFHVEDNHKTATGDDLYSCTLSAARDWVTAGFVIVPASGGASTVSATIGSVASAGLSATIAPGAATISNTVGSATSAGQVATIGSVVTIPATIGATASAGLSATIAPGGAIIAVNIATLVGAGLAASVLSGGSAQQITVTIGSLLSAGLAGAMAPGAITIPITLGSATSTGLTSSVAVGGVTVQSTIGSLSASGYVASLVPGAITIPITIGAITSAGLSGSIAPGAVIIPVSLASVASGGLTTSITTGTFIQAVIASAVSNGLGATVVPGAASINATIGSVASNGLVVGVLPSGVTIPIVIGSVTSTPYPATINGTVSIPIGIGGISANGLSASLVPGGVVVQAVIGTVTIAGQTVTITAPALLVLYTHLETTANLEIISTQANIENLVTQANLEALSTSASLELLSTQVDLDTLATQANLDSLVTTANLDDLGSIANLDDLNTTGTMDDLDTTGTIDDLSTDANIEALNIEGTQEP